MNRIVVGILIFLSTTSAPRAAGERSDKPPTPAEQYKALVKEYQEANQAKTDEERKKAGALMRRLPLAFLELAEKNPKDPVAVDALIQVVSIVNGTANPAGGKDSPGTRAMTRLLRDYLKSDKLGPVCLRISFGFRREYELFLRTVLETSPHKDVQGLACLALAHYLNNRLQRLELIAHRPDLAKRYDELFGKDYVQDLKQRGHAKLVKEAEAVFEQAIDKYDDVKIPEGMANYGFAGAPAGKYTVGEKAKLELFELRDLAVGNPAPDIEGEDQDGKRFKLSDYRGKVVLLDFWHQF